MPILIDIAGVLTEGGHALAGASEAMRRLQSASVGYRLITNTTRRPKRVLLGDLAAAGFEIEPGDVFTPAQAAVELLRAEGLVAHLLIHPDLAEDFDDLPTEGGAAVVVGDAGRFFDYARLNAAFRHIARGAAFYALAANRSFRDHDGDLSMDAGAFVRALEYASGQTAIVLGKPSAPFFDAAVGSMGCRKADCVMIGDDAEADVAGALKAGIGRAYLVRTGKYADGDEARFQPPPTAVYRDFAAAVSDLLGE